MFCIFTVVVVTQVYTLVKIHPTPNLNGCNLLYLDSVGFKKPKLDLHYLRSQLLILANPESHELRN